MHCTTRLWTSGSGWTATDDSATKADLVLCFGAPGTLDDGARWRELHEAYPAAHLLGCSTGGEILGPQVHEGSVVAAVVDFAHTAVELASVVVRGADESRAAGEELGRRLARSDLGAVFVLSDGTRVNGSALVEGLRSVVGDRVAITGGLAGDGAAFQRTVVGADAPPCEGRIGAVGLYGARLRVGHGSAGGWHEFGPDRIVTRASGNVLYELDGTPALALYKKYLGDQAAKLPASALLFPLRVERRAGEPPVVRTILSVDDASQSMTFAGDIPAGAKARFMRGTHENLVEGASGAAREAAQPGCSLSVLVSCIGRKLLMGQNVEDEVEAATWALGAGRPAVGFYSYGEIAPSLGGCSELHNQTMTITTFAEE